MVAVDNKRKAQRKIIICFCLQQFRLIASCLENDSAFCVAFHRFCHSFLFLELPFCAAAATAAAGILIKLNVH